MQYAIAHLDQDGNGDSDKNPYISVDFENNLESCLEAANMMEDEGYKEITPFILEDEGKSGTYTWEYVRQHSMLCGVFFVAMKLEEAVGSRSCKSCKKEKIEKLDEHMF